MKSSTLLAVTLALVTAAPVLAQQTTATQRGTSQASKLDSVTTGSSIRASKLMGMNIQNSAGKSVGEINDFVINADTGKIQYAAVTYGGFLGIGNKMFAVPFEAFKFMQVDSDTVLVLNVTEQQLEGAVGFDEDHWPNFADEKFTSDLYKRYGVDRNRHSEVNIKADRDGVKVDVDRDRDRDRK